MVFEWREVKFILYREKSLPYILAQKGYDVWVGNNRGTRYSQKNSHLPNYWEYNFDHFVEYDQPKMINSVLRESGSEKLIYIGHSQGSTQFLLSVGIHNFADKIACFIGMGTVISLENVNNHKLLKFLAKTRCIKILKLLGFKTVLGLPRNLTKASAVLVSNNSFYSKAFVAFVKLLCGEALVKNLNHDNLGVMISHSPGGASIPNV